MFIFRITFSIVLGSALMLGFGCATQPRDPDPYEYTIRFGSPKYPLQPQIDEAAKEGWEFSGGVATFKRLKNHK